MSKVIKQDMTFLEYSLWMQHETTNVVWEDRDGFIYATQYKTPVKTDVIFLYYLLLRVQEQGWDPMLTLSHGEILRECGLKKGKWGRDRLRDSLKRWDSLHVEFRGTFYDGVEYQTMHFGVIDSWKIRESDRRLTIRFSPEWLLQIQHSNFYKLLDFEELKALKSPLATRLYEILFKSFQGRDTHTTSAQKLALRIPLQKRYPADIIPLVRTAVRRINAHTDLQIELAINRPRRGVALLTFKKVVPACDEAQQIEAQRPSAPLVHEAHAPDTSGAEALEALLDLVPPAHRPNPAIKRLAGSYAERQGLDYVREALSYARKHSTQNYPAYLGNTLKEGWHVGIKEDTSEAQKAQRREAEAQREAAAQRRREAAAEAQIQRRIREALEALSAPEKQTLEAEALACFSPAQRRVLPLDSVVPLQMRLIMRERLEGH